MWYYHLQHRFFNFVSKKMTCINHLLSNIFLSLSGKELMLVNVHRFVFVLWLNKQEALMSSLFYTESESIIQLKNVVFSTEEQMI